MASTSVHGRSRVSQTAPDKGSFPLDHFHECEEHAVRYNACLDKHQLMPKRCQKFQIQYLECRMKHNLMGKEKIENLGYTEVNTYENEEQVSPRLLSPYIDNLAQKIFVQEDMRDR
jgi:cytochrome c oxidase assembly protein subunit 19